MQTETCGKLTVTQRYGHVSWNYWRAVVICTSSGSQIVACVSRISDSFPARYRAPAATPSGRPLTAVDSVACSASSSARWRISGATSNGRSEQIRATQSTGSDTAMREAAADRERLSLHPLFAAANTGQRRLRLHRPESVAPAGSVTAAAHRLQRPSDSEVLVLGFPEERGCLLFHRLTLRQRTRNASDFAKPVSEIPVALAGELRPAMELSLASKPSTPGKGGRPCVSGSCTGQAVQRNYRPC